LAEISNITNFNIANGAQAAPNGVNKPLPGALAGNSLKSDNGGRDCFVNSNQNLSGSSNPLMQTMDDYLARVAPKVYLGKYMNKEVIQKALCENPAIVQILSEKGIKPNIYMANITGENQKHFLTTYKKAKELGKNLSNEDYSSLLQAALVHDVGKAFIPPEILNKPGRLTDYEKEIVDLHARVGAEVLKTTNLSPKVIEAVNLHHTGYQNARKQNNTVAQMVSAADVYSALKEERPYKKGFSDDEVCNIMQSDPNLNPDIVDKIFVTRNAA